MAIAVTTIAVMVIVVLYGILSVADAWHVLFLEDGHDGDADDNRGDERC